MSPKATRNSRDHYKQFKAQRHIHPSLLNQCGHDGATGTLSPNDHDVFRSVNQYKHLLQILRTHDLHNPSDRCPVSNDAIRHLVLIMFKGAAFMLKQVN
jgi:hypothetical protein